MLTCACVCVCVGVFRNVEFMPVCMCVGWMIIRYRKRTVFTRKGVFHAATPVRLLSLLYRADAPRGSRNAYYACTLVTQLQLSDHFMTSYKREACNVYARHANKLFFFRHGNRFIFYRSWLTFSSSSLGPNQKDRSQSFILTKTHVFLTNGA